MFPTRYFIVCHPSPGKIPKTLFLSNCDFKKFVTSFTQKKPKKTNISDYNIDSILIEIEYGTARQNGFIYKVKTQAKDY